MSETIRYPLHVSACESLKESGKIEYGQEIPWEDFEEAAHSKRLSKEDHGWEFRSVFLAFCEHLMEQGFKVSQDGMNGAGFRILTREEMADHVLKQIRSQANKNLRSSIMLSNVPQVGMDAKEISRLEHASVKAAFIGATQKRMLSMRKLPATPEMARKLATKMDIPKKESD
jgi:hypothetical protein